MSRVILFLVLILAAPPASFAGADLEKEESHLSKYIGVATMDPDGTIVLQYMGTAEVMTRWGPDIMTVHGFDEVKPDDPDYKEVFDHIGGIQVGEEKLVPRFDTD